jgi:hypothetical protein
VLDVVIVPILSNSYVHRGGVKKYTGSSHIRLGGDR